MALLNEMYTNLIKSFPQIITAIIVFVVGMIIVHILNKIVAKRWRAVGLIALLLRFFNRLFALRFMLW